MAENKEKNKIPRRRFIKGLAGAVVLTGIGFGGYALPKTWLAREVSNKVHGLMGDKQVQYLRQLVTADNSTSRRIMWQSANAMEQPKVLVRPASSASSGGTKLAAVGSNKNAVRPTRAGASFGSTAEAAGKELQYTAEPAFFTDDGSENLQYTALLDKLQPDTAYEFAIDDGENTSDWHPLKTVSEDKQSFEMLIFPDSQSSDYSDWSSLAQGAIKRNPNAELFTNMGDLVDNGEDSSQWRAWFNGLEGIIDRLAFAPVMGNHECYNKEWQVRLPEAYLNYFQVPDNGSGEFRNYYYSFDYGDVHFTVINTQENEISEFKKGMLDEEIQWVTQDLASTKKKWKIVLMHRDVLQYRIAKRPERKEGYSEEGEIFMPLFEKYKVDIVFTAHLHTYRNRGHIYQGRHDSQGPLYILTGVAGNVRYPNLWTDHALDEVVAPQPETDNYLTMQVDGDTITVRSFLPDGSQIDEVRVKKAE